MLFSRKGLTRFANASKATGAQLANVVQTCCAFKALGMLLKRKEQLKFKIEQIGGKCFAFKTTVTDIFDSQRPTECR